MKTYVLPLSNPQATLETVGGKGMLLANMTGGAFESQRHSQGEAL
jgi:hypothetical protein